jgi:hypothetical protein
MARSAIQPAAASPTPRIRAVTPLFLVVAGVVATAAGIGVLLSYGSSYRVGRLLAATPKVSLDDALALAASGDRRYVRVDGRLDSDEDFPDDHQQPLVYRRRRLELRRRGRWQTFDEQLEAVPFEIREGLSSISIDHAALDDGLVVLPRESAGTAGEIPERVPDGTPASTPARLRVDQISSIEHAIVLGVPVQTAAGPQLTSGFGRPLVLSTLEIPEAMRVLGGGRARPTAVLALIAGGLGLVVAGLVWAFVATLR